MKRAGIAAMFALMLAPSALLAADPEQLETYLQRVNTQLPGEVSQTLQKIAGTPRQLLAARSYLRVGKDVQTRWSWTAAEIEAHTKSPEYRALMDETAEVRRRFEAQNPGYTLYANTEARSLELQISRFNTNKSVGRVADVLYKRALAELDRPEYAAPTDAESVERFVKFLSGWRPPSAAPLAAPGISRHGQLRAIDFQIMKNGVIVAPTETSTVKRNWDAPGWTERLRAATEGSKFRGPLPSPYEPWHYEYDP